LYLKQEISDKPRIVVQPTKSAFAQARVFGETFSTVITSLDSLDGITD